MLCLDLDPDDPSDAVQRRVRRSWPASDAGNSDWGREENVVFLRLSPGQDSYGNLRDIRHEFDPETGELTEVVRYHRSWRIHWVCYGPDSDGSADAIRAGILRDGMRGLLRRYRVAIQPGIPEPVRVPEQDGAGAWWERCDLTAQAYELVARRYPQERFESAPEIILKGESECPS